MSGHYQYYTLGAMNNILSNGNHNNDKNTTVPSTSLSVDAFAVAVVLPLVQHLYYGVYMVPNP